MDGEHDKHESISTLPSFRIWLCGPFRIERRTAAAYEPVRTSEWGGSNYPRLLLKALLCSPGRRARREALLEMLWPEASFEQAAHNLNTATTKLRTALRLSRGSASLLITEDDANSYELADQQDLWLDAEAAQALLNEAERTGRTLPATIPLLEEAARFFQRGPFLEGEESLWTAAKRATLEQARYRCQFWLVEAYECQELPGHAETLLSALLEEDPTDEGILSRLMELLHRQGMTHRALRLYQEARAAYAREGSEPTEAMSSLAERIKKEYHAIRQIVGNPSPPRQVITQTAFPPSLSSPLTQPSLSTSRLAEKAQLIQPAASLPTMLLTSSFFTPGEPVLLAAPDQLYPAQSLSQLSTFANMASINPETLALFAQLTETCRCLSEGNELKMAEHILWTYLPKIELAVRLSSEHQLQAAHIASQGYLLAASLVGHRNNLLERLRYSEQALLYAKLANDLNLQVVALRQIAISFDCMRCPDKVLQTYEQTLQHLKDVSPLLQACVYADISGAHAQFGHEQEANRFIGMAYDYFPANVENEPRYLHTICRYSSLIFWDGLNRLLLQKPHEAKKIFEKIDGLQPKIQLAERVRIELLNYQVEVFTVLKDMQGSTAYLEAAVKAALTIGCERHFQESFTLFQQMKKLWHNELKVQRLAELFMR